MYANFEFGSAGNRGADFNQYRSAAILAGTGRLYDPKVLPPWSASITAA